MAAAEDGEDKLIAVARHIARTLGRTDTMADDILRIFSSFDGRFSREKLSAEDDDDFDAPLRRRPRDGAGSDGEQRQGIRSIELRISRLLSLGRPLWSDAADSAAFLSAFDALLDALPSLDPSEIDLADDLLQRCTLQLEDEFRFLVEHPVVVAPVGSSDEEEDEDFEGDAIPIAEPVADLDIVIDALPSGTVFDLREIAKRMVAAGFGKEAARAYSLSRRGFLEESVSRLGLRPRSSEEARAAPWEEVEGEIARWTKAVAVATRVLFPSERRLVDRVFGGLGAAADLAFAESCRGVAVRLLGFADAVAGGGRAPERLFRVVDMYEALREVVPEIDAMFTDRYTSFIRADTGAILKGLALAISGIFMELENLIRRDPAKSPVPGGGLHPITRYVMNYLRAACASRRTLEEVMENAPAAASDVSRPSFSSSLGVQIAWIMEVLQGNLEAKSKVYGEGALSSLFLMNNGRYIIQKVSGSELRVLLGDDWIRRQSARVRRWQESYQRGTWGKVVAVLRPSDEGTGTRALRDRLRVFNAYLEEIVERQCEWVVADGDVRAEIRAAAAELVVPAYRGFLGRVRGAEHGGRHVKYSVEDVRASIGELFSGGGNER